MQVETYESTEIYDDEPENRDDAFALVVELGLNGQEKFFGATEEQNNPYRLMTQEEHAVYHALFPTETKIEAFKDGPIPLRVLQVAAHARQFYPDIRVWHERGMDDPVLVGYVTYNSYVILARWGNALMSFSELRKLAGDKIRADIKAACVEGIAKLQGRMAAVDAIDGEAIVLAGLKEPSVYV